MPDWLRNSVLYEINTWVWLDEWRRAAGQRLSLAELPNRAWDQIARFKPDAVWLMGIWERSPAGLAIALSNDALRMELQRTLPDLRPEDVPGSPYCVRDYVVDRNFGGAAGLAAARQALAKRGIRLLLDFVPNHIAPDHPWVRSHPDWLVRGSRAELRRSPDAFLAVDGHVFARGRDPYFPPWSDVLQLNAFSRGQRRGAIGELQGIAEQCDGVRCDMAMLLLNQVFARTWLERVGSAPDEDYWREVIPAVKSSHPEFRFIAEAYWDLELTLLEQGFDACYDKRLYDQLVHGHAESVREHLLRFCAVQDRLVRFIENHDEPRATVVLPASRNHAAAVVVATLPGIRLWHNGQIEGRRIKTPVQLGRRPTELEDQALRQFYLRLSVIASDPALRRGEWLLCEAAGSVDNLTYSNLLAWCWKDGESRWLVVVNYSAEEAQGRVRVPWLDVAGKLWRLVDRLTDVTYDRDGDELSELGLFVRLEAWTCHILCYESRALPYIS